MENEIRLNNSEWEIMECLWEESPQTIMQLVSALKERIGWAKSTTNTMVRRMEAKGYIRYEEGVRARAYYPVLKREDVVAVEAQSLLTRAFHGNLGLLVNTLVPQNKLTEHEIEELREILRKAGGELDDTVVD